MLIKWTSNLISTVAVDGDPHYIISLVLAGGLQTCSHHKANRLDGSFREEVTGNETVYFLE